VIPVKSFSLAMARFFDECALLAIPIGEQRALLCDPINIRCAISHHAAVVSTYNELPNVITPNHEDVWLVFRTCSDSVKSRDEAQKATSQWV